MPQWGRQSNQNASCIYLKQLFCIIRMIAIIIMMIRTIEKHKY